MNHPIFPNGQCVACGAGLDEQECCQTCQPPSGGDYPVNGLPMMQTIYFDAADDSADGFGWNVVDGGAIAARFPTLVDAMAWCGEGRYVLRPTLTNVPRFLTVEEIAVINKSIEEAL
jgi:hypothetical protein